MTGSLVYDATLARLEDLHGQAADYRFAGAAGPRGYRGLRMSARDARRRRWPSIRPRWAAGAHHSDPIGSAS
jgi:hypothetical protein